MDAVDSVDGWWIYKAHPGIPACQQATNRNALNILDSTNSQKAAIFDTAVEFSRILHNQLWVPQLSIYIKGWTCDSWARLARLDKHPSFQSNHGSSLYVSRSKSSQGAISWATASRPPRSFGGGLGLLEPDQVRSFCEHGSKEQKILPCDCKKRSISDFFKEVSPSANIFEQQWPQETNNKRQQNQYRQNKNTNDMEQEFSNNLATEEVI